MAFRAPVAELSRPERGDRGDRWDRDRFFQEQDRGQGRDRDGYVDVRDRFEREADHVYARGGRDASERRYRKYEEDDVVLRERRTVYDDEPRVERRRGPSPESEVSRRVFIQRERERVRSPSPPRRRPGAPVRRQSSLDTFDRRPIRHFDRDISPPIRGGDYRAPPYMDIPLPRHKALPPPRRYVEREYEDIQVADPHRFGDDDFRLPEVVREKEMVRTRRRRSRSRSSRTTRRSSRSSSTSSSSTSGGTTVTTRSEYPKKGKTRIPARLISKRALIEFGYPFVEEVSICQITFLASLTCCRAIRLSSRRPWGSKILTICSSCPASTRKVYSSLPPLVTKVQCSQTRRRTGDPRGAFQRWGHHRRAPHRDY